MSKENSSVRAKAAHAFAQKAVDSATPDQYPPTPVKPQISIETRQRIAEIQKEFQGIRETIRKSADKFYLKK